MRKWQIILSYILLAMLLVSCACLQGSIPTDIIETICTATENLETTFMTTESTISTTAPETTPIISDPSITFTSEVVNDNVTMPYVLYTPSTASTTDSPIPLIIWLHGRGDGSIDQNMVDRRGLPCALTNWELDGFNAYIVCPQLYGKWNKSFWFSDISKSYVDDVVDRIVENYNIDTNRIIISGHSDGGKGALFMAAKDVENCYSTVVSISGCDPEVDDSHIKEIFARGYTGLPSYGELNWCYHYTTSSYAQLIGEENVFVLNAGHIQVAVDSFLLDENNDNKSDLIEWMLNQYRK